MAEYPSTQIPTTFHNGVFHTGHAGRRDITDEHYACEYDLQSYLAAATAGQRVAVGMLHCPVPMSPVEYERYYPGSPIPYRAGAASWVHEIDLVVVPDVGVWICAPVFRDAAEALEQARSSLGALESVLERELPINIALIAMIPDVTPSLAGIDPALFYDTQLFSDVVGTLSRRARPRPGDLDALIDDVLSAGTWLDSKRDFFDDWELPRWVADLIY